MPAAMMMLLALAVSLLLAWVATPLAASLARRLGVVDRPGGYKQHGREVALLGGLPVALATAGGALALAFLEGPIPGAVGLLAGAVVILAGGLIDDVRPLPPHYKLLFQVSAAAAAGLTIASLGVKLDLFLRWPALPMIALTALWVVAATNALNLFDNMDGLCAGVGALAALSLGIVNWRAEEAQVAILSFALAGACLGFLPHNWPKARVFLGDTGSMFIGFSLAALSVMGVYTRGAAVPGIAVLAPIFVLALPMIDMAVVVWLRLRAGRAPWLGDRCHISHRLVRRGMRPATAVVTLWLVSGAVGLAAVLLPTVGMAEAPILALLVVCILTAIVSASGAEGL